MIIPLILVMAVLILAIFITNANQTVIELIVFGYHINGTIGLLIMGTLGAGIILGMLSMLPAVMKRSLALLKKGEELAQMKQKEASKKP